MKIVYLLREYFIPSLPLEVLKYVFNYYYPAPLNTYYYFFIGPIPTSLPIHNPLYFDIANSERGILRERIREKEWERGERESENKEE